MRRGMLAAGVGAGILAVGVPAASAGDISITFDGGTTTVGTLSPFAVGTAAAPATLKGTIADSLASSTFPKAGITLPTQTLGSDVTAGTATGKLSLVSTPASNFTGTTTISGANVSVNLTGTVDYTLRFVPNGSSTATDCALTPSSPLTLTGQPINLTTGAYAASGQTLLPTLLANGTSATCLALTTSVAGRATKVAATGKIAIPGLIPLPATPAPTTTTPSGTTTAPTTTTPTELGPAQLALVATKPKKVKRGKSTTFKFAVANGGGRTARSVKVTFKTPKGVKVAKKTIKRSTLAAGTFKTYTVRLRTTKKAKKSGKVTLTAKAAGGLKATAKTTLKLR